MLNVSSFETVEKLGELYKESAPEESEYEVLQSLSSERFGFLNLVKLHPKTGRRHQLRKHLASIENPILGDVDYGMTSLILKGYLWILLRVNAVNDMTMRNRFLY